MSEALMPTVARPEITRPGGAVVLPAVIVDVGPAAVERFLEFFAARIANAIGPVRRTPTRQDNFWRWCEARGLGHTARTGAAPRGGLHPDTSGGGADRETAPRGHPHVLCDWLVVSQVLPTNPAAAVRGPKHVVTKGATPVL